MKYYCRFSPIVSWLIGYIILFGITVYLLFCLWKANREIIELKQKIAYYESCRNIRDVMEKAYQWEDKWLEYNSEKELKRPR